MRQVLVALDMGGTNIKSGIFDIESKQLLDTFTVPVNSAGTLDEYRDTLLRVRSALLTGCAVRAIQVSTPGPFDYAAGVSHMVKKYKAINGLDLRKVIRECLGAAEDTPVGFLSDANAFLLGEYTAGEARGIGDTAVVTLGTGLGFAIMQNGRLLVNEAMRPYHIIAFLPYEGAQLEDFVSGTGLPAEYFKRTGIRMDAKQIALSGTPEARKVYRDMGTVLGRSIKDILELHSCRLLIIGGQMAASADLFLPSVREELPGIEVKRARGLTDAALIGAAHAYDNRDIYQVYKPKGE